MNYFDHRQITRWADACKRMTPLTLRNDLSHAEPLIPSQDGFVLTADNRLAFRFMLPSLARQYDMDGLSVDEAYALMARLENLPAIEQVAKDLQRDFVKIRKVALDLHLTMMSGKELTAKQKVALATVLRDTGLE